uniref:Peroxin-19 n=1 Tax=Rhabditophanes sp. KR3021 TaxID=114890 RepID=A0AC35TM43_9BILA
MPFEEYMEHTADVEMPENVCDADVENNLDSDDEDLGYLQKVMQETKDQFGKMSMGEIDSTLTANGINCLGNEEEMMNGLQEQLTDEERKAFSTLFDTYQQEVAGLGQSCFSKRV